MEKTLTILAQYTSINQSWPTAIVVGGGGISRHALLLIAILFSQIDRVFVGIIGILNCVRADALLKPSTFP